MIRNLSLAIALAATPFFVAAHDYELKSLYIDRPFARATPPGARTAGAFLTVENKGSTADRLIGASSPVAGVVEVHEMAMDGGVMKMRAVSGIEINAGARIDLKPGGYHVMLMDLKQPLALGERFPLTLTFEKAGKIELAVKVEAMGAVTATPHKHDSPK